jgi:putative transcriptional regulator
VQNFYRDHFLIAMPSLNDPCFFHSVAYVCEHTDEGAMGIIINQPLSVKIKDLLFNLGIETKTTTAKHAEPVLAGGPMQQERGFVVHEPFGDWQSSIHPSEQITVTTSRDILEAIASGTGPEHALIALGYAGWSQGQLEQELAENAWLVCQASPALFFETAINDRWEHAAKLLGVDIKQLSNDIGHA